MNPHFCNPDCDGTECETIYPVEISGGQEFLSEYKACGHGFEYGLPFPVLG